LKRRPYEVEIAPEAEQHFGAFEAGERAALLEAIERQLRYQPTFETRNRKRMDPDKRMYIAPWELRVGDLRVYYAVREKPGPTVVIVAFGAKERERVKISGRYIEP
jgi:mRNA-degrading endonuclease RelE of RelBE toxin-antitoxin system